MRALGNLFLHSAFLATLFVPAIAMASGPHSWCITGDPMVKNGSTDATTNSVVGYVCARSGFESCCTSRWGLSCVQTGAAYAKQNNLSGGDYCGRYAWAEGPIAGTEQYYPRDFNLVAVAANGSGNVGGLRDVEGPVATSGYLVSSYFHLNNVNREGIAAVAQGKVSLASGTVKGKVLYGNSYSDNSVTFVDASRPTAPASPFPIDFSAASAKLIEMSQALNRYEAIPATNSYGTVKFTGTDPELNVFSLAPSVLAGATSFDFAVPPGSSIIVNVGGQSATFKNAGFTGAHTAKKLLWNFLDATTLVQSSVAFPGSILAPKAVANLQNGNIRGTVVVASAPTANVELYSASFQIPSCSGGLCLDPTWSCSSDTAIDDAGRAVGIGAEAGFLEIAGGDYQSELVPRTSPKHRIWYSFQPAQTTPKNKPIAIIFNGGPGGATTSALFAFNTGTMTLYPLATNASSKIESNPNNWTKFANLLYIDAPTTGFSYPLANDDGSKPDVGLDMDRDAGIFLRVIVRFLARHPGVRGNRVILVGESYGGTRATLMLQHLFNYSSLRFTGSPYRDLQLSDELDNYFASVFPYRTPSAAQIASKFSHQVLIEPAIVGEKQAEYNTVLYPRTYCKDKTVRCWQSDPPSGYVASCDVYNCDQDAGTFDRQSLTAATALTNVATLNAALGVNAKTIEWMKNGARTKAYGRDDATVVPNTVDMNNAFGPLAAGDNYLVLYNPAGAKAYGAISLTPARTTSTSGFGAECGTDFAKHLLNGVSTLITVAKYDAAIWAESIHGALDNLVGPDAGFSALVTDVAYDRSFPFLDISTFPRPGGMRFTYKSGATRDVIMPHTYESGHTVPMRAPAELLSDVMTWYTKTSL